MHTGMHGSNRAHSIEYAEFMNSIPHRYVITNINKLFAERIHLCCLNQASGRKIIFDSNKIERLRLLYTKSRQHHLTSAGGS